MPLAPPPDGAVYPTWAECIQALQSHAAREGYAVNSRGQAKSKETGLYRRYVIRCDKSGKFKSTAHIGIRRMSTKKTDCRFSAAVSIRPDGCHVRVLVPEHNHPPSALPGAHVQHRKMTDEQRQLVETRAVERKSIKLIWEELKSLDPNTYVTFKDVDNYVQKFRKQTKEGATGVQAIMYKLVERQDLFCFTLEREGALQGAFWVPRWCTDLWMRNKGTPDILVMLTEHIANRPVLSVLEMNSVLNSVGFQSTPPGPARPNDHISANPYRTSLISPINSTPITNNSDNSINNNNSPAPNPPSAPPMAQSIPSSTAKSSNGLDASLGAGYAILPDKSDATILWLRSAVEKLRKCIPHCPKPRYLTLTDFQTAEKNILVEVSRGGVAHSRMHLVFGRVLEDTEENQAHTHHGVQTRKPRVESGASRHSSTGTVQEDDVGQEDEEHMDGEGEQEEEAEAEGEDDNEEDSGEDGEGEDQDSGDDGGSETEIARQFTGITAHGNSNHHNQHNGYDNQNTNPHAMHHNHNPGNNYQPISQRNFEHPLPHMLSPIPGHNTMLNSLQLPQVLPPPQLPYSPTMGPMLGAMMPGHHHH
ncbi:hypothetical protein GGS21DRAFT_502545 [Xylaria nigripes]|nr:hypothetical protein GGS21DRAFT_502545 [Xylaria nigripes]